MENLLEVLRFLAAPFDKTQEDQWKLQPSDNPNTLLNEMTEKCIQKLESSHKTTEFLKHGGPVSGTWKLTCLLLDVLLQLKDHVEKAEINQPEEEKSIEVLSLQSQLEVQKCVELVVGFGIVPYLLPGVGVPEKLRPRNPFASEVFLADDRQTPHLIQYHRLAQVLEILIEVSSSPSLNSLIVPKHATDLLAGLLQICKSPVAKPPVTNLENNSGAADSVKAVKAGALTEKEYEYVMGIRKRLEILMESTFLDKLPKSLLVNSLFIVGATEKPKWMRNSCNEMLCSILLSSNGLILISSTLLAESPASSVWKLARIVSNLMSNALLTRNNKEECQVDRLADICSQCVQMITCSNQEDNSPDPKEIENASCSSNRFSKLTNIGKEPRKTLSPFGVNQELSRIGLFCSIVLMDINCQITKRLVWNHLFGPVLLQLGQCQMKPISGKEEMPLKENSVNEDMISIDIEKVMMAAEFAEGLLSLVIPMDVYLPLHEFQPLWSLFFQVFVACKNYLEQKIQEPNVAQLAEMLISKLENVLLLLLEIVSSGAGDKLDLKGGSNNIIDKGAGSSSFANKDKKTGEKSIINMDKERAKTVCEFCVQLLLNETEDGNVSVNKFELQSFLPSEGKEEEDERESVKIVHVTSQTAAAGCQSAVPGHNNDDNAFELLGDECAILCSSILKHERVVSITSQLFCQLLSYENETGGEIEKQNGNSSEQVPSKLEIKSSHQQSRAKSSELTQLELQESISHKASLRKFIALKLLSDLGGDDTVVEKCVKAEDFQETLNFLELIMRKLTVELKASSCTGEDYEFGQSVIFALGILGTVVETASGATSLTTSSSSSGSIHSSSNNSNKVEKSGGKRHCQDQDKSNQKAEQGIWDKLTIFTPHLRILHETNHLGLINIGIPSMAESILCSIESRGTSNTLEGKVRIVCSRYEKALKDVANPILPIKGHGLLELKRLIEERDSETIKNEEDLIQIFQKNLINEDSYVYLMAIQGLSALGIKFHKTVVPVLIQEYDFINPDKEANGCQRAKMYQVMTKEERIECRMKIGEVLVKIIQKLGDIAPVYRVPLTNLFFRVVLDDEPLIRASALSNLGELCHLLKFSLGAILTEVWHCIESLLNWEKDTLVRRAALHLVVLLLKGVENDSSVDRLLMDVQLGTYIRDVRRLLTKVEQREMDPVAKTHAQLALQELRLIVEKVLLLSSTLEYKIRILE